MWNGDLAQELTQQPCNLLHASKLSTDTAYSALMGSSVALNTDQDQVAVTDELVGDENVGVLDGQTRKLGVTHVEAGAGEGQPCAERESQEDFVEELTSRRGR